MNIVTPVSISASNCLLIGNYVGGTTVEPTNLTCQTVYNPATGAESGRVMLSGAPEVGCGGWRGQGGVPGLG